MANAPGYDPNDLAQSNAARPGATAALQDKWEPGSTSKVMSMAAVLEEGAATPGTHVTVPNRLHRGDRLFRDDIDHPTWYLTLNGVLAKSSNIGTILATGQLGEDPGRGQQGPVLLPAQVRHRQHHGARLPGRAPPASWGPPRTHGEARSRSTPIPFGRDLSLNAMQAASVYQTIANGGVRIEPTPGPRDQGRGRPLHGVRKTPGTHPGGQREDGQDAGEDAGVRRGRPGGHGHQGAYPRLPRRGQDRHGQPCGSGHRPLPRLHLVLRRIRARGQPPGHRLLRHPERHRGAATSAVRSAGPSTRRSWSSP